METKLVQDNELCAVLEVPHAGQYLVKLTIRPEREMRDVRVFARKRRLYAAAELLRAGETYRFPFYVEVCDVIPAGETEIRKDRTVDVSVVADHPCISGIEAEEIVCPVLHLAGDSTVTDQIVSRPCEPETSYAGWGQMLPYYLGGGIAVANHAYSGLTTETFRQKGYYSIAEGCRKEGDFIFFQFGHNDQKLRHLRARGGYRENLIRYIEENRAAGLYPVLVTPLARNTWNRDGGYHDLLADNAAVCLELGEEMDVPVLDLHGVSARYILEHGNEGSQPLFVPGDYTHTNICGAQVVAGMVASEMKRVLTGDRREAYRKLAELVMEKKPCDEPRREVLLRAAGMKPAGVGMSAEMLAEVVWASQNGPSM